MRRPVRLIIAMPLLLCGCMQMTRHSNTMVFGTNTVMGVSAALDASSVPSVTVGYRRQEAVIMPLVANVGVQQGDQRGKLVPCPITAAPIAQDQYIPCILVGKRNGSDGSSIDTYSVMASFGGKASGSAGSSTEGGIRVAQFFSTGNAALLLAATGGAALVNTSDSVNSPTASEASNALTAVLGKNPYSANDKNEFGKAVQEINDYFSGLNESDFTTRMATFLASLPRSAAKEKTFKSCVPASAGATVSKQNCIDILKQRSNFVLYEPEELNTALGLAKK